MTNRDRDHGRQGGLSRRDVLRFGAGALGAASFAALPRPAGATSRRPTPVAGPRLVVLNLKGGNDGLNTVVPITLQSYYERRPGLAIAEGSALSLDLGPFPTTQYGLHPALGNLQTAWGDGDLAIVQKVGYPDANGSHFESETIYSRCRRDVSAITGPEASGWIARLIDVLGPAPTGAVAIGAGTPEDFRGCSVPLLGLGGNLSSFSFETDWAYSNTNDPYRKEVVKALLDQHQGTAASRAVRDAALLGHELEESIRSADENYVSDAVYPSGNGLASDLQTAAKLIQGGFATRVFYVDRGGYDTHSAQAGNQNNLHAQMDAALAAFAADLQAMGVWDDTVVLVISEFGRRNFENGSGGTDHGAGSCLLALGGAVSGGLYGPDLSEADLEPNSLAYAVDFRSVYKEVVAAHFGVDAAGLTQVFPEAQELDVTLGLMG